LRSGFRPLRSQHVFPTVCLAVRGATRRNPERFRIVQFSVQWNHMHLIVEASDKRALSAGIRSLAIRIARYVNDLVGRKGRLWADRWHGRALETPRQVRTALVYVLANFRKHSRKRLRPGVDAFSSALKFDGWRGFRDGAHLPRAGPSYHALAAHVAVSAARTWLGGAAWRRLGLLRVNEAPADSPERDLADIASPTRR
jgi:REP element-mobilizing transposase RayT